MTDHRGAARYSARRRDQDFIVGTSGERATSAMGKPGEHLVQALLTGDSVGSGDIAMGIIRMGPRAATRKHHHPNGSEFYYVLRGQCHVNIDGIDIDADEGTAIYVPAGSVHWMQNTTDETIEFLFGLSRPSAGELGYVHDE